MTREEFISLASAGQESLRRFLLVLCNGDAATSDDIAQEALVNAYMAHSSFRGASRFETWLFRIAYNCFIDHLRRSPEGAVDLDSREAMRLTGGAASDASFEHEELQRALKLIPEKERTAIVLFYFEDLPIKEIASIMDAPAGTVKYYLSTGRNHLKEHLEL